MPHNKNYYETKCAEGKINAVASKTFLTES